MAEALMIANTAMQFIGNIYQGEAEGSRMNRAGDVAQANARNARLQASAREDAQRRQNALQLGNIRASAAQSGFDSSTGSLAALQTKSAGEMELDALTTRYQGQLQAISFDNEAAGYRASAKNARKTGYMNAFGSLMSGGSSLMGSPRVGPPAPVESRTPTPNPYYKG